MATPSSVAALSFYWSIPVPTNSLSLPPPVFDQDTESYLYDVPVTEETPLAPPCQHVDVGYLFDTPLTDLPYFPIETLEELPLQTEAEIQEQLRRQEEYEQKQAEKAHMEALRIYFGIRRIYQQRQLPNAHVPGPMTRAQALNEFCKRRPPAFYGEPEPTVAEAWLKEVKVIFSTLDIARDGDRVALAAYQLKGEARYWWELMETTHNIATMTFAEFERSMTVAQYATKFEELSRYAPTTIASEDDKERKFEWGLTSSRKAVVGHEFPTYSQVVKCALWLEREDMDFKAKWKKTGTSAGGPI
ncbi:hypothetical protein RHMOL_Rhmol10G0204900 [Rhododendron molle]|uniref:Uncharacterized protein n=1 Tax=Rhododendron molle TaxID=49168 RepID=A0ACC0M4J6_RHOML|nr:hypothetical protein RHMOL_Rhmol10G0204900 [Rhododendron molle]